jgi:fucose 4-O-acetylase-like acetyltransferase
LPPSSSIDTSDLQIRNAGKSHPSGIAYNRHMPQRDFYIDHLRTVMTVLVVLAHAGMTYGSDGFWFYNEIPPSHSHTSILLSAFTATMQAFPMGMFFMLAGYFTPRSFDRKGPGAFLLDRSIRLGIPLLVFGFILAPLTLAMRAAALHQGVRGTLIGLWRAKEFINGPLWFTEGLLLFSIGYALWRVLFSQTNNAQPKPIPLPSNRAWMIAAISLALVALTIRQFVSADFRIFGLWVATFPPYILLFIVGINARRHNWLSQLTWKQTRPWLITACLVWPLVPIALQFTPNLADIAQFLYGFSWRSILYAFWDPLVAWGAIAALLLWFSEHLNQPSALWTWLGRRAYAVYIIHPPVLVAVCLMLRGWHAPPIIKFGVAGTLGTIAVWLVADPLVRLPGLRRII